MARKRGMGNVGDIAAGETNKELAEHEAALLLRACTTLHKLKPEISDKAAFDELMQVVQECTTHNIQVAEFQARVKALGEGVVKVAKEVTKLVT